MTVDSTERTVNWGGKQVEACRSGGVHFDCTLPYWHNGYCRSDRTPPKPRTLIQRLHMIDGLALAIMLEAAARQGYAIGLERGRDWDLYGDDEVPSGEWF